MMLSRCPRRGPLFLLGLTMAVSLGFSSLVWAGDDRKSKADDQIEVVCPDPRPPVPEVARSETYLNYPFKAGEESKFELKYGPLKVLVGYGFLRVGKPVFHSVTIGMKDGKPEIEKRPQMVFQAEAYTGDWYRMIFAGHDKIQAFSRPWDFGITKFYMSQDEEKPFVRRYHKEKWLDFDHYNCQVNEREIDHARKKESQVTHGFMHGAVDALGAVFRLRSLKHEIGKPENFVVYTTEKNWVLEATPLLYEKVKVNAGEFETVKLGLKTFLGKELQQKGDVFVWIAHKHPHQPIIKVEGEVTFGSIYLLLDSFKPGS